MSLPRIQRENRRDARRGPDLTAWALSLAAFLLNAVGLLKRRPKPKGKQPLSAEMDREYWEHLYAELMRVG